MADSLETLRFLLLGDDRASGTFSRFARNVDEAARSVDRFNAKLAGQQNTIDNLGRKVDEANKKSGGRGLLGTLLFGAAGSAWWAGAAPGGGIAALGSGLSPLLGAGLGLGAFSAVAIPELTKVLGIQKQIQAASLAAAQATTPAGRASALAKEKQLTDSLTNSQRGMMKSLGELSVAWQKLETAMGPTINKTLSLTVKLFKDLLPVFEPLAEAGGKMADAFLKPLDALFKSGTFALFIGQMIKFGTQFSELFGGMLVKVLADLMRMFTALAPAGMALWKALAPLVQTLVYQLAGLLGKLLPPLTMALTAVLKAVTPLLPPLAKLLTDILVPIAKSIAAQAPLFAKLAGVLTEQLLKALLPIGKAFLQVMNAMLPILPPLVKLANQILPPLIEILNKPMIGALTAVANAIAGLSKPISWFVNQAVPWLRNATGNIAGFFQNLGPNLARFGKQAFSDLWSAIKSVAGNILSWAANWVSNFIHKFSIFGWHPFGTGGSSSGPGGGQPAANAAQFKRMFPQWSTGANWNAVNNIAMAESGWNNFAQNASGAYGIPQALPFTKMPKAAWPASAGGQSDPGAQNAWFGFYMQNRYGGPIPAWNWHLQHGWYDQGGWLQPGLTLAYNGTGRPEPVGGAGSVVIQNLYVTTPDGPSLVRTLQAYAMRNGPIKLKVRS